MATRLPSGDTARALILPPPVATVFAGPPPAIEVMDFRVVVVSRCSPAAAPWQRCGRVVVRVRGHCG